MVAQSIRSELRHVTEDRDCATSVGALDEMSERGAHCYRIRVPGVVEEESAARQLRLLRAPAGEDDLHRLLRRLDAERLGRGQRRRGVRRLVTRREIEDDVAVVPPHARVAVANFCVRLREAAHVEPFRHERLQFRHIVGEDRNRTGR